MNEKLVKVIEKHHLHPKAYLCKGKVWIIKDNHSYVIKLNTSNYDIYKYLLSRGFNNYPENFNNKNDDYDLNIYIEDESRKKEQKVSDLIKLVASLHKKTSYIRELTLDDIKKDYEYLKDKILQTKDYYEKLNDSIDKEEFLSPSRYLLIRNISLFYYLLNFCEDYLYKWYQTIKDSKRVIISINHNNLSIDHLIVNDAKYLISWDKASFDMPINDIEIFFRNNFENIELSELIKIYEEINKITKDEKILLLIHLALPDIISFTNNTYKDITLLNREIIFLNNVYTMVRHFLKEEDK